MNSKIVWDTGQVYSLVDILRNHKILEVIFGRAFFILGIKNKSLVMTKRSGRPAVSFKHLMSEPKLEPPLLNYFRNQEMIPLLLLLRELRLVSER